MQKYEPIKWHEQQLQSKIAAEKYAKAKDGEVVGRIGGLEIRKRMEPLFDTEPFNSNTKNLDSNTELSNISLFQSFEKFGKLKRSR